MALPLLEDRTKAWLAGRGVPVPRGAAVATAAEAADRAAAMPGGAAVKALVPTGRRGKAGAVRLVADAAACRAAAAALLGTEVAGFPVDRLYVEERVTIAEELYLAFVLDGERPEVLASRSGGVDIEAAVAGRTDAMVRQIVDPARGLTSWDATELWLRCGVAGPALRPLAEVTSALYAAFRAADALTLELNPLALTDAGGVSVVGAMMAVDEDALFRHPEWRDAAARGAGGSEREQRVREASLAFPGGACEYVELDGDIGLLVGGGGAGLHLHDLVVDLGGRPANHCVTPPTGSDTRKLRAVIEAILDNPRTRGLLVGFNFAQMARADIRVRTLVEVLRERDLDTTRFPIVIRLFGPGEDEARALAAAFPGIAYLPRGASLRDAARRIVERTGVASRGSGR